MKTVLRNSYTPQLDDYCDTFVIDKETGNQYLFDADGVWTLISTDEEGIVAEAVAQANAYTDDVAEGKVDKEEGKGLSENDFTDEDKGKLDGIETDAQKNIIEIIKRNGAVLPVTDKTVDIAVPTTTSSLTNDSGYITNEVDDLTNYYDKDETDTIIATEAETRDAADLNLQEQIDAISSASDVVDVVGTYAELQNYDTSKLSDNDIIKVLTDETHDGAASYYRWNDTTEVFTYIGSQGPFYTKSETDATFVPQTRAINGKRLNSDVVLTAADVNALPASTVIPMVNDGILTIQKNGTTVATFTANSTQNVAADISVPTKVSDLTNDLDFVEETDLADVAFSGIYADIIGTPLIPTKTSDLTNDSDFVSDANYVHTDNNFTTTLKDKLEGIAAGAEVNVQPDWDATDTASDAFIKNKPSVPAKTSDLTNDSGYITSAALPTKTSDLTNDSGFITKNVSDLTNYYTQSEVNGMFNALSVPTKTSDLVNDSGFLTSIPIASATTLGGVKIGSGINVAADGTISAAVASLDWNNITNRPTDVSYWTNDAGYITSAALPTKTSDLTNDSNFVSNTSYATTSTGGVIKVGSGLEIMDGVLSATGGGTADSVEWENVLNKPTFSTVATSGSYNDLIDKPTPQTVNDATLTIQRNSTNVGTFTANASSDKTINITVPTTVAELSDASVYVTQSNLATQLANKQNVLTAGDHINITDSTIKAVDYVHSDDPVPTSQVNPVVTNDMIADGTITADKLATGATLKLTLSTSDIGEGAALAANTLYGVYM